MADTIVTGSSDSGAGWAVAVIILLAVVVGGFVWFRYHPASAPAAPGASVNVTIPNPASGGANQ